jgi:hypothetical protein
MGFLLRPGPSRRTAARQLDVGLENTCLVFIIIIRNAIMQTNDSSDLVHGWTHLVTRGNIRRPGVLVSDNVAGVELTCPTDLHQPVRLADGWCWFVVREKYCWLVAGGWFVLREKYCWLVADKPSEQGASGWSGICIFPWSHDGTTGEYGRSRREVEERIPLDSSPDYRATPRRQKGIQGRQAIRYIHPAAPTREVARSPDAARPGDKTRTNRGRTRLLAAAFGLGEEERERWRACTITAARITTAPPTGRSTTTSTSPRSCESLPSPFPPRQLPDWFAAPVSLRLCVPRVRNLPSLPYRLRNGTGDGVNQDLGGPAAEPLICARRWWLWMNLCPGASSQSSSPGSSASTPRGYVLMVLPAPCCL